MSTPAKSYDILKVYFKFKILNVTFQLRRLLMYSNPKGETVVFTISTDAKERD